MQEFEGTQRWSRAPPVGSGWRSPKGLPTPEVVLADIEEDALDRAVRQLEQRQARVIGVVTNTMIQESIQERAERSIAESRCTCCATTPASRAPGSRSAASLRAHPQSRSTTMANQTALTQSFSTFTYERHRPEETLLYALIEEHYPRSSRDSGLRSTSHLGGPIHLHMLVLDGVCNFDDEQPRFHRVKAPTQDELAGLLHTIATAM